MDVDELGAMSMGTWGNLRPGDEVVLRRKRPPAAGETYRIRVTELLPKALADGVGVVDASGAHFRSYFYDVVQVEAGAEHPDPEPTTAATVPTREEYNQRMWDQNYALVREFIEEHGRLPLTSVLEEQRPAAWCASQRARYREQTLKADRRRLMEELPGWDWAPAGRRRTAAI